MTFKLPVRKLLLITVALGLSGVPAMAQVAQPMERTQWDNRRLEQLDRNVRRLERALTQRNAQGQPVLVEPDPEVVALQGRTSQMDRRLSDIEATFQRMNADNERLTFALDEAESDNAALRTRLTQAETRIEALETAAAAAVQQAEQAATEGASPTGDAAADLAAARALAASDPARGAVALQDVSANWPDTAQGQEASWRLGDLRRSGGDMAGAVQAYAGALAGWPTAPWAGETTLKLARGLIATDRAPQACGALGEFDTRYAASASASLKAIAEQVRDQGECEA